MTNTTLATPAAAAREAKRERVRREKARRHLIDFMPYVAPWYQPGPHHRYLALKLEQVFDFIDSGGARGIGRLLVQLPPRHGKSEEVSQMFPAWTLGRRPDTRIINIAYGDDLATGFSRATRDYVRSDPYRALFGDLGSSEISVEVSQDSRSSSEWNLMPPARGGMLASGIGGGVTGKGAHLLTFDDPFRNRADAESEAYRRKVIEFYRSVAYTRLEKGGAIIICATRWHPDDLTGYLLKQMASGDALIDQWEVVDMPALAWGPGEMARSLDEQLTAMGEGVYLSVEDPLGRSEGEALWPEKYSSERLQVIERNIGPYDFASLYQQRPAPAEGLFFDHDGWVEVDAAPAGLQWYGYIDVALSEKKTADYNTVLRTAFDAEKGDVYYRDMLRLQGWDKFREVLISTMLDDTERGTIWGVESVAFSSLAFQELVRDPRLARVAIREVRPQGDKTTRARPLQTRVAQKRVKLLRGAWLGAFYREAALFPRGKHDDQIDTATGGLEMAAKPRAEVRIRWV